MLDLAVAGSATVLPAVLDFDRDREASPARMNRAMEYLYLRLAAATALQPEFESAIGELQAVGLDRLNEVLGPIFAEATSVAAQLDAIKVAFLTGQPLAELLADLEAGVTGRLTAVDAQLASNLAAVTAKLGTVDTKLAELSPTAKWASATADEARAATAQRLISAAILWAMLEPVPLTDAALIPIDLSKGVHFTLPLGGNRTLAAPTSGKPGQEGFIRVVQDGAGGRTLSFAAAYRFPDLATAPSLNAAPGAVTLLRYHVSAMGEIFISGGKPAGAPLRRATYVQYDGTRYYNYQFYTASEAEIVTVVSYFAIGEIAVNSAGSPGTFNAVTTLQSMQSVQLTLAAGQTIRMAANNRDQTVGTAWWQVVRNS